MRRILIICIVPVLLLAQEYYEVSGRTEIFTLKAGGKAPPVSTRTALSLLDQKTAFHVTVTGNILRVNSGKDGKLKIFMLDGRAMAVYKVNSSGIVILRRMLKNGVYLLRFEPEGSPVKVSKLVVTERGLK